MKKKYLLLLFIISLNFVKSNEDFLTEAKSHSTTEIHSGIELKEYLGKHKKCFVEIYSPSCSHCVEFAPKYETLASIYKDKINFVKLDGSDYAEYRSFAKIRSYPALFLYDNSKLFEYRGKLEVDHLHQFIEDVYYFKCKKIESEESLINFIEDNNKSSYVLGILNKEDEKMIESFMSLNADNRMLVENCHYYINDESNDNNSKSGTSIYNLPHIKTFIIVYNQKNFNYFTDFSTSVAYLDIPYVYEVTNGKYRQFLLKNLFPLFENYDEFKLNSIISRDKNLLIFSHQNEREKMLMEMIINQYSLVKRDAKEFDVTILLYDINEEKNDKSFSYFNFSKKSGIYLSDVNFKRIRGIEQEKEFDVERVITLIEEYNNLNKEAKSKAALTTTEQKVNYVSAKIVDSLSKEKDIVLDEIAKESIKETLKHSMAVNKTETVWEPSVNMNVNANETVADKNNSTQPQNQTESQVEIKNKNMDIIHKFLIYLPIYSIIFYIIYRKYLNHPSDETKNN